MKKIFVIAVLTVVLTANLFSQTADTTKAVVVSNPTENIVLSKDSAWMLDNVYAGILNTTAFSTKEAKVANCFSFRVGAKITWKATKWMSINSFATLDYSDGNATPINSFSVKFHDRKNLFRVEMGYMATPSTESRPLPPSGSGHFETYTEASAPGSAFGIKAGVKVGQGSSISAGAFIRNKEMEYHARFASKFFEISGYANPTSKEFGGITVIKAGRVYDVTTFKNRIAENLFCNFINIEINKKRDISWYCDFGFQINTKEIKRLETGVFKTFTSKWVKGLVCIGYRHEPVKFGEGYESSAICAYLFIHL